MNINLREKTELIKRASEIGFIPILMPQIERN